MSANIGAAELLTFASMRGKPPCGELTLVEQPAGSESPIRDSWDFLTNHAHVLLCIANDPDIRLRDVAKLVGITERAAQNIVADLVRSECLVRDRIGRRNKYEVNRTKRATNRLDTSCTIGEILELMGSRGRLPSPRASRYAN